MFRRFSGTYPLRLDDKGRVTVPVKYRPQFSDGTVVVRGRGVRCLYLHTAQGYDTFSEPYLGAAAQDPAAEATARYMSANSEDQNMDGQGRVMLSSRMREYAGLTKDVVLIGFGERLEVWDAELWAAYEAAQEGVYAGDPMPSGTTR